MNEDERIAELAPETDTQTNTPADVPADPAAPASSADERIAELERLLATERDAATNYMQRWQRAAADFANFRRRAQQEAEQREQLYAAQALAPALSALDSLERAFSSLPDTLRGYTWIEGIALVDYQLRRALDAQGITEVAAEPGQPFDPTHHQAVGEVETDQHPAGHIATLLQRGYQTASLLIRPALVQVARAPGTERTAAGESEAVSVAPEAPEETQPSGPAP